MMSVADFQVLRADRQNEKAEWLARWEAWPDREVSAHPSYGELFARPADQVLCATTGSREGGILFPLILRPLAVEPWAEKSRQHRDLTSPYGYGGPYVWETSHEDAARFWAGLRGWAAREKIVTLFGRLSVFPEQLAEFDGEVSETAPNVVRTLDLSADGLWMDYEHKVRKNVKRAQREGLRVEVDWDGIRLDEFLGVYRSTMDRRDAGAAYYFDRPFFERLISELHGQYCFIHVLHRDVVVSTELVLVSPQTLYSFLGGTVAEAFEMRPNDLLKHETILLGKRLGKRAYVLGGGYGGPDGIFRYKLSFAPRGAVPFRTGRIVFAEAAYAGLIEERSRWERMRGVEWQARPGFFPEYRG